MMRIGSSDDLGRARNAHLDIGHIREIQFPGAKTNGDENPEAIHPSFTIKNLSRFFFFWDISRQRKRDEKSIATDIRTETLTVTH